MKSTDSRFEPLHDRFCAISSERVREIESRVGVSLPKAYTEFLSLYGGCGFAGEANVHCKYGTFPIFTLFDFDKLIANLESYEDLAVDAKVPIGDDMASNLYVLSPVSGAVHFIDFSANPPIATTVAESFEEFVTSISVKPYD